VYLNQTKVQRLFFQENLSGNARQTKCSSLLQWQKGIFLAGDFNPFEEYYSNWIISPSADEKMVQITTQFLLEGANPQAFNAPTNCEGNTMFSPICDV